MINKKQLAHRNKKLRHLFIRVYESTNEGKIFIRLIGGLEKPRILVGENNIIEGYIDGNQFVLTDGNHPSIEIKLKESADEYSQNLLNDIKNHIVLTKIFKVRFGDSILFLSGFKYFGSTKSLDNGYPIFSKYNPKIYYDKEYAETVAKKLNKFGYQVEIE